MLTVHYHKRIQIHLGETPFFLFYVEKNLVLPGCVFIFSMSPLLLTQNTALLTLVVATCVGVFPTTEAKSLTASGYPTI